MSIIFVTDLRYNNHVKFIMPHTCGLTPEDGLKWVETCNVNGRKRSTVFYGCNKIIYIYIYQVELEVLMVGNMKMVFFLDVVLCCLVEVY
jgi:hypothetical protein